MLKDVAKPGLPLEAIALFGQRGDTVLIALSDSGISSPKDFEGRTVGYKVFPAPEYLGMLKAAGVNRGKINEVGVGFDPRVLTEKKVDVLPVFRSNEPDTLQRLGFSLKLWDPADYGVPTLGVTYVVVHSDLYRAGEWHDVSSPGAVASRCGPRHCGQSCGSACGAFTGSSFAFSSSSMRSSSCVCQSRLIRHW